MASPQPNLVFDFDSTLVTVEGADELFASSLEWAPDRAERVDAFRRITEAGMEGSITYAESFYSRLALLEVDREDVEAVGRRLLNLVTPSVQRNRARFREHADRIWIVSGGFEELIEPVASWLGLGSDRILAHRLTWRPDGRVEGVDPSTAISRGGKPTALREMDLPRPIWVIGDGSTDLELRRLGLADRFFALTENCHRPAVVARADHVVDSVGTVFRAGFPTG